MSKVLVYFKLFFMPVLLCGTSLAYELIQEVEV